MEELVIINYNTSEVHFYKVDPDVIVNDDYISLLGHNPDECSWMQSDELSIIKHKGILKNEVN